MVRAFQCPISNYGNAGMGIRHIYVPKAAYFTQKCVCHLRQKALSVSASKAIHNQTGLGFEGNNPMIGFSGVHKFLLNFKS